MADELMARLETALHLRPGQSARELAAALGLEKRDVNSTLYRGLNLGRFSVAGDAPPLWSACTPSTTHAAEVSALPFDLYGWQRQALTNWARNGGRGIVEAVTGAGKTRVALAAIFHRVITRHGRAAIVVPTKELQRQWVQQLQVMLPAEPIGRLGDGASDDLTSHRVIVAIANSAARWQLGLGERESGLLVADECHRLAAPKLRLALEEGFGTRLGLSATYERADGSHQTVLEPYFGRVVYSLGFREALDEGVIAPVRVAMIAAEFNPMEQSEYDELSEIMRRARTRLVQEFGVTDEPYDDFIREVQHLARNGTMKEGIAANRYLGAVTRRRALLAETSTKLQVLDTLIPSIRSAAGALVFTQTIDGAEAAASRLVRSGVSAEAVHSNLDGQARRDVMQRFAAGSLQAIVAPQVLDEGVDVPAADLAVILAATSQRRQMVQRMGRVLRRKPDGRSARFAITYIAGTIEDPATGAHEAFFDEVLDIAEAWASFDPEREAAQLASFLGAHGGFGVESVSRSDG